MNTAEKPLVNRVASSGLITFNLESYYPEGEIHEFDLKNFLFKELILKEKDFRQFMADHDWNQYHGGYLLIYCSTDAIIPVWAYMLVAKYATPVCKDIFMGDKLSFLSA